MKRIVFFLALVVVATAGFAAEPVPNLPDYNGTYWGTPNTGGDCDGASANCDSLAGRKMFTTLYRDNYERESGCAGEGCGKHPGVDIDVVSGTPVGAALSGTVVRKESCNSSWGGLVVIESTNPYASGNVYHSYAHLRSVSVSNGDWVDQGEVIGNSGGASSDPCHGASTGSHLHFQVDKPHGGTYPWFPTGRVEDADSDFEVLEYTHNPLPFVQGYAYNFTFAEDGNKEFWGAVNVPNYFVSGSYLRVDSSSTAPYVGRGSYFGTVSSCGEGAPCSREIIVDADIFKRLVLTLNYNCVNNPVIVWFRRGPSDTWHGGSFNYTAAGAYTLNIGGLSQWYGIITDLRIKLSSGCTANPGPEEYRINQAYFLVE